MHCREFRKNHVAFVDDLLCAAEMSEMRDHLSACRDCSANDVRVRRGLLLVRNMPTIEVSESFAARLEQRLREAGAAPVVTEQRRPLARYAAVAAALIVGGVLSLAALRDEAPTVDAQPALATALASQPGIIPDAALIAAVPAGVPVWPAVFMVGQLPMHLGSVDFVDADIDR